MNKGNGHVGGLGSIRASTASVKTDREEARFSSRVAALFDDCDKVRETIHKLEETGFDSKKLSVLAKGEFWDQLSSDLRGLALVWIPGFGPLILTGPLAWEVATALRGAKRGDDRNPLEAALASIGIPNARIFEYEAEVRTDKYLLIAEGSKEEVRRVHALMTDGAFRTDQWNG